MANYSVLLVAALVVISVPVLTLFILAPLVRASRANKVKLEPYECGVPASSLAFDHRFSVRYFLIAVLFIIFDVETVFLFPWAIRFKQLGWFGAVEMAVFLGILLIESPTDRPPRGRPRRRRQACGPGPWRSVRGALARRPRGGGGAP